MKAYIVYEEFGEDYLASLVLENGWVAFSHICSHSIYMAGDLFLNNRGRKNVFEAMEVNIEIEGRPISKSDSSLRWLIEKNKDESCWREFADEYKRVKKELFCESENKVT